MSLLSSKNTRKNQAGRKLGIALLSAFFLIVILSPFAIVAVTIGELISDYEGEISVADPLLINAMKTTMYEYVADDEEIEIVSAWIRNGSLSNEVYTNDVVPILKNNCTKCHSASSTMSDAAPDKPLTTYEELRNYLNPGLPTKRTK